MKRFREESGMTLMEMLACILILSLLVTAMGTGMDTAMKIYEESLFTSDSALLAEILNTALEDVLGFARKIREEDGTVRFSNGEYGIQNGYLQAADGMVYLQSGERRQLLVNTGAYGGLRVEEFTLRYFPRSSEESLTLQDGTVVTAGRGGFWYVSYRITDGIRSRQEETVIRPLNGE